MDTADRRATFIWLTLTTLSIVTYAAPAFVTTATALVLVTLGIALAKAHLVSDYFMGLRAVGGAWRPIMIGYLTIVGAAIVLAFMA